MGAFLALQLGNVEIRHATSSRSEALITSERRGRRGYAEVAEDDDSSAPSAYPRRPLRSSLDLCHSRHTKRLWSRAARMKDVKSGCGSKGFDLSSGWYCTPMNQGWPGSSTVSGSSPSGDMPEKSRPARSSRAL